MRSKHLAIKFTAIFSELELPTILFSAKYNNISACTNMFSIQSILNDDA